MSDQTHWDRVYTGTPDAELTWFEAAPAASLAAIEAHLPPGAALIDVGGGTGRLAEALLERGHGPLSVLDLSPAALARGRQRLGARAGRITWIEADVTRWSPDRRYALWHDRAVFHFLTAPEARAAYVRVMMRALEPGGVAVISTFADDGPQTCSGLPVTRYSPEGLAAELDRLAPGRFAPLGARRIAHVTPKGRTQAFQQSVFRHAG